VKAWPAVRRRGWRPCRGGWPPVRMGWAPSPVTTGLAG
jgi:hypothetical protein